MLTHTRKTSPILILFAAMLALALPGLLADPACAHAADRSFSYTGAVQSYTIPKDGYYMLETWGAQGGCGLRDGTVYNGTGSGGGLGGYGGYSYGYRYFAKGTVLYVSVGGRGANGIRNAAAGGGWNGGGNGDWDHSDDEANGAGGGCTSIQDALVGDGQLKNYSSSKGSVILVAGGGAGGGTVVSWPGSAGGGLEGQSGASSNNGVDTIAPGGTQSAGGTVTVNGKTYAGAGSFGQGGHAAHANLNSELSGGGGGWYGGAATPDVANYTYSGAGTAGGGGSGYIGGTFDGNTTVGANGEASATAAHGRAAITCVSSYVEDLSGNDNKGCTYGDYVVQNGAMRFGGTNYLLGNLANYDFASGITIAFRIKSDHAVAEYAELVGTWDSAGYGVGTSGGTEAWWGCIFNEAVNTYQSTDAGIASIGIGEYHTIVFTYNGATMALYDNGALAASSDVSPGEIKPSPAPFMVGGNPNVLGGSEPYCRISPSVYISDVLLYDTALPASTVAAEFSNVPVPSSRSNMKLWYSWTTQLPDLPSNAELVYTGEPLTVIGSNAGYSLSGVHEATAIGHYTATATPWEGYCWSDGTVSAKNIAWDIVGKYTVSFDGNEGEGDMPNTILTTGVPETLPLNSFSDRGNTFMGWCTSLDGSGTWYDDGQEVVDLAPPNGSITLHAMWSSPPTGIALPDYGDAWLLSIVAVAGVMAVVDIASRRTKRTMKSSPRQEDASLRRPPPEP